MRRRTASHDLRRSPYPANLPCERTGTAAAIRPHFAFLSARRAAPAMCTRLKALSLASLLLRRPRQLDSQRALDLGNNAVVRDGLARLVLVDGLRVHLKLLSQLLLRQPLGGTSLGDGQPQILGDRLVCSSDTNPSGQLAASRDNEREQKTGERERQERRGSEADG